MKKIGFVTPWYGKNIPGGAEMELRGLTEHLQAVNVSLEILTTCVKDFNSDWSQNYHKPGSEMVEGILVRRFPVRKRNDATFHVINGKLMKNLPITKEEEIVFMEEMINSPELYRYISEQKKEYSLFVYIPYMFGTTYYGIMACPEKSVVIPCFHDESYLYFRLFKELFPHVRGMIYNAKPEYELANKVYDLSTVEQLIAGIGMDTELEYSEERFRDKFQIDSPYILYAGRKDVGKNIYTLIKYFTEYKRRQNTDLKLIMIGGGEVQIPVECKDSILDIGFVDPQDKYDACAGALLLCQPSIHESFSLVIMESWLCERPILVHKKCDVTKRFAIEANGGLYFDNYFEFEGSVNYLIRNPEQARLMGQNGKRFVKENFAWSTVINKYIQFFERLITQNEENSNY